MNRRPLTDEMRDAALLLVKNPSECLKQLAKARRRALREGDANSAAGALAIMGRAARSVDDYRRARRIYLQLVKEDAGARDTMWLSSLAQVEYEIGLFECAGVSAEAGRWYRRSARRYEQAARRADALDQPKEAEQHRQSAKAALAKAMTCEQPVPRQKRQQNGATPRRASKRRGSGRA
jgi:hypothetical protein